MTSTRREYFDEMYANSSDPWRFETSEYEQRKYALTVAALPRAHYRSAFEPGCSVGVLTELLAPRCECLFATDVVPSAVKKAQSRLASSPHAVVEERAIPRAWPAGPFDLVVLSEIAYYFDEADLASVVSSTVASMMPEAHLIGVHWRGTTNYPLSGDRAHALIDADPRLRRLVHHVESAFVLDVWERS